MELGDDDITEILKIFEQSKFEFLHLEHGELKLSVAKTGYQPYGATPAPPAPPPPTIVSPPQAAPAAPAPAPWSRGAAQAPAPAAVAAPAATEGLVPIAAP